MIRNLNFLRSLPADLPIQDLGVRLYEALSDIQHQQQAVTQQTNSNPVGNPDPPPAIDGLTVTGQNGHFHLQVQHNADFYRGVQYHAEYADNPGFQNPRPISMGDSREHTIFLGNGTYYWRAFAAYPSSPAGPAAYHGGAHSPQPVSGGGSIGSPAFLPPQGSGTGAPGEGLSGPGPIPFRSATGAPPIRGTSLSGGGSSGGSLRPGPQTGLPPGMTAVGGPGGGSGGGFQYMEAMQSGLAAIAATLSAANKGQPVYVTDYDHTLYWTGAAWSFRNGERSDYTQLFHDAPTPSVGWHICDGSAGVSYLKSDGTLGTKTLPDLVGSPSFVELSNASTGVITAAVHPTVTNTLATSPATTGVTATGPGSTAASNPTTTSTSTTVNVTTSGSTAVATGTHTHTVNHAHTVGDPTVTDPGHSHSLSGSVSVGADGMPQRIQLLPYFRL